MVLMEIKELSHKRCIVCFPKRKNMKIFSRENRFGKSEISLVRKVTKRGVRGSEEKIAIFESISG
jgi:hypothetical protein